MFRKIIYSLLAVIWMGIIFSFSSQEAVESEEISHSIVTNIIIENYSGFNSLDSDKQEEFANTADHLVRKSAHFCEYAILGILFLLTLRSFGVGDRYGYVKTIITAIVLVCLYSISDELHQSFVPGRNGNIKDVFIDTSGGVTGIILLWGILKLHCNKKSIS